MLPATSVALAVIAWTPGASAVVATDHAPAALARPVPTTVAPSNSVTVAFASAVPVKVSVLHVGDIVGARRAAVGRRQQGPACAGAGGAAVSRVKDSAVEPVLPATSVCEAVSV